MTDWKKAVDMAVREGKLPDDVQATVQKKSKKVLMLVLAVIGAAIGLFIASAVVVGTYEAITGHKVTNTTSNSSPIADASTAAEVVHPSFDCAKASSSQEKLICSDADLAKLDAQLADAYSNARKAASDRAALLASQRAWIKQSFNACNDKTCLTSAYQSRIAELTQGDQPQTQSDQVLNNAAQNSLAKCLGMTMALDEISEKYNFQEGGAVKVVLTNLVKHQTDAETQATKGISFSEYNRVYKIIITDNMGQGNDGNFYDSYREQIKNMVACSKEVMR